MISKHDLERLLNRAEGEHPVLSLFLDMSVNSDNKRTHQVFLNQRRAQFDELDSDRDGQHREAIGRSFAQIQRWVDEEFDEENRGVVMYLEVGGDWFEALQFPVPVTNRLVISERPYISPLAEVIQTYHHQGVVLLDREHVRILSVYLGTLLDEIEVHGQPYPTPHDVQAGGYSQQRFQRRKLEEMKHFFREFSKEVDEFIRRYQPKELVILGTDENVAKFREFLSEKANGMVVFTSPMRVDETPSEILLRLQPHLDAERKRESEELLDLLRGRVKEDYLATAGFQGTLSALQEGKVDTLVIGANQDDRTGARCTQCGYVFPREVESCPFDGAGTVGGVNVVEEVIRLAEAQGAEIEFVPATDVEDLRGVGALLRF
jgi:peptide chain release factor subunit 1